MAPDVEVDLPDKPFQANDLELNPDLEDDDDMAQDDTDDYGQKHADSSSDDLVDVDTSLKVELWTLPFDNAYEVLTNEFYKNPARVAITESQQSRFINYVDGELLQVQRRFIKNQAEVLEIYPIGHLLEDVRKILDLIWYLIGRDSKLYGQDEYFIRITGDLEDWIAYYLLLLGEGPSPNAEAELFKLFNFFQSLDTRVSFLIDGYTTGQLQVKLSSTEVVRLVPIISRLRFELVSKLDPFRSRLTHLKAAGNSAATALLNKLDVEIGRLFEGVLERT